eukprot:TRINITY_DN11891_c0_g2_i2.p2 TRINITY_DN11891_c0_g2~~TRINITY_DN11891_c0_g2_i2.p2  ORF type:complete len:118 (+),score=24.15 TRINITY_DN11891_c0_g2_i2:66-419(+)
MCIRDRVDVFNPDLEAFPDLSGLHGLESVELFPGDALLIPCGWWHEIESSMSEAELSVMVGYNWPVMGDAIAQLAPLKDMTKNRILTQGEVVAQFVAQHPEIPVAEIPEEIACQPVF